MLEIGTRSRSNPLLINPPQGTQTRVMAADPGMTKRAVFSSGVADFTGGRLVASSGDPNPGDIFAVGDIVVVEGTNLNNGYFEVIALYPSTGYGNIGLTPTPTVETPPAGFVIRTP